MMQWSHYSEAIFAHYLDSNDNIIVQACPGAGKTTNIQHIWSLDTKSKVYLVFNKHNQLEAQAKLPRIQGCDVLTLNGLGHRAILNTFERNVVLDDKKVINLIRANNIQKGSKDNQYNLARLVQIMKGIDIGKGVSVEMYFEALSIYDIEQYSSGMYHDALTVLGMSDNDVRCIDYADQLRFPVIYNCNMPRYDVVLGDEVQDFNPVQVELLRVLNAERYILVGDCHQSMYGFRGAMSNSMTVLKERFKCVEFPLSITYRCAKSIVRVAARLYSDIEEWNESPEGRVRYGNVEDETYTENDIILCRMNRPLIAMAYDLLRDGIPCHVRGRDIGQGLVRLIKRQGCFTVYELINRLHDERDTETQKARLKENDDLAQRLEDKYTSALLFCSKAKPNDLPQVVIQAIEDLFNSGHGVCLSTVHKAKGLEAQRAFMLEPSLHKSFKANAKHAWQGEQEKNIEYVAVTRAKEELVYL